MALRGTNSIAHDDFSMIVVTDSQFFRKSRDLVCACVITWDRGFVHVGQVKCVPWKGHSTPAHLALNSAPRQRGGRNNSLNLVHILLLTCDVYQLVAINVSPSLAGLYTLISKLKRCFSDVTIPVMMYVNTEPTQIYFICNKTLL